MFYVTFFHCVGSPTFVVRSLLRSLLGFPGVHCALRPPTLLRSPAVSCGFQADPNPRGMQGWVDLLRESGATRGSNPQLIIASLASPQLHHHATLESMNYEWFFTNTTRQNTWHTNNKTIILWRCKDANWFAIYCNNNSLFTPPLRKKIYIILQVEKTALNNVIIACKMVWLSNCQNNFITQQ